MRNAGIALVLGAVLGAGCSAVPLRTMWKMRNFSPDDLAQLDPNDIRLQVITPGTVTLAPDRSRLAVTLVPKEGAPEAYAFPLEIVEQTRRSEGLIRKRVIEETTLRLTAEGVRDFVRLQGTVQGRDVKEKYRSASISASGKFDPVDAAQSPEEITITIRLKLRAEEEFFTLFDDMELKVGKGAQE